MNDRLDSQRLLAAYQIVQQCCASSNSVTSIKSRLQIFAAVESTNQTAWQLMAEHDRLEPIVMALRQTAGRGQRGRHWQSEPGGLYLSVGFRLALPVSQAAELTIATAWGIAIALRQIPAQLSGVEDKIPVQLKWLNDLVLNGYKLGGILTETHSQREYISKAVIGVGINWTNPVPPFGINLQTVLEHYPVPLIESLELLTAIVLHGIFSGIYQQQCGNINQILPEYVNLLTHRDRSLWLDGKEWVITGITATGALRVRQRAIDQRENMVNPPAEILIQPGTINLGYPCSFGEPGIS